jgi:hypothetical protein
LVVAQTMHVPRLVFFGGVGEALGLAVVCFDSRLCPPNEIGGQKAAWHFFIAI